MPLVAARGVELEKRRDDAVPARLDVERELGAGEALAAIVQLPRIDHVTLPIVHARGDERILEAVGVQIADARAPRAVVLEAERIRDFAVLVRPVLLEEAVSPDARLAGAAERDGPLHVRLQVIE